MGCLLQLPGGPEKVLCSPRVLQPTHTWVKVQVANDRVLSPDLSRDSTLNSCKWRHFQPQKAEFLVVFACGDSECRARRAASCLFIRPGRSHYRVVNQKPQRGAGPDEGGKPSLRS